MGLTCHNIIIKICAMSHVLLKITGGSKHVFVNNTGSDALPEVTLIGQFNDHVTQKSTFSQKLPPFYRWATVRVQWDETCGKKILWIAHYFIWFKWVSFSTTLSVILFYGFSVSSRQNILSRSSGQFSAWSINQIKFYFHNIYKRYT